MSRSDQYDVTVSVKYAGTTLDLKTFDSFDGGEMDSEETKFWPGGMGNQISLGGRKTVGNVTVGRLYDLVRDHPIMGWLMAACGTGVVTITKTSLTVDEVAVASPLVYSGTLKSITPPGHDSTSSDAAMWEMEVTSATVTQNSA